MIRYGKLKSLIFESTLVTAVFTAICFLLGDVAHQRLAVQLGVPRHLLHKPAPQVIIANGSLYILFLLLIFLLLWAFVFVLFKYLPQKFVISTKENLKNRYLKHTIFYKLFMVLVDLS